MDFVSPENIKECIRLTEEFRKLPIDHKAREDKLEVKDFHTIYLLFLNSSYDFINIINFMVQVKKMILYAMHQSITDFEKLTTEQKL